MTEITRAMTMIETRPAAGPTRNEIEQHDANHRRSAPRSWQNYQECPGINHTPARASAKCVDKGGHPDAWESVLTLTSHSDLEQRGCKSRRH
jgi:hypothetical protein